MKLLSKQTAQSKIKKDNQDLLETNIRLHKFNREMTSKLNTAKLNYDPEKIKAMEEFDKFSKDLLAKKSVLLEELTIIQKEVDRKKELYYALIEKQDALEERIYQVSERENKVELRERFISEVELRQWNTKKI